MLVRPWSRTDDITKVQFMLGANMLVRPLLRMDDHIRA